MSKEYEILNTLTESQLTTFFMEDPKLTMLSLSDEEIAEMWLNKKYIIHPLSQFVGILCGNELHCLLRYEWFTRTVINCHMYIPSKLHHTEHVRPLSEMMHKYVKEEIKAEKIVLFVPTSCDHIHKFASKWGYEKQGEIKECTLWRQLPSSLVIYALDLTKEIK